MRAMQIISAGLIIAGAAIVASAQDAAEHKTWVDKADAQAKRDLAKAGEYARKAVALLRASSKELRGEYAGQLAGVAAIAGDKATSDTALALGYTSWLTGGEDRDYYATYLVDGYAMRGEIAEAEKYLTTMEFEGDKTLARAWIGISLFTATLDAARVKPIIDRAVAEVPHLDEDEASYAAVDVAYALAYTERYDEARKLIDAHNAIDAKVMMLYALAGQAADQHRPKLARQVFDAAEKLLPRVDEDDEWHTDVIDSRFEALCYIDLPEAKAALAKRTEPSERVYPMQMLAQGLARAGQRDEAMKLINAAEKLIGELEEEDRVYSWDGLAGAWAYSNLHTGDLNQRIAAQPDTGTRMVMYAATATGYLNRAMDSVRFKDKIAAAASSAGQPATTQPPATQPAATQPAATQPATTRPEP